MEESKENLNDADSTKDGNIFGWKWSMISLVVIIISVVSLVIVKKSGLQTKNETEMINLDSISIETIDTIN